MNIPYYVLLITFYEIYKSQITSIKFQINPKFQKPMTKTVLD